MGHDIRFGGKRFRPLKLGSTRRFRFAATSFGYSATKSGNSSTKPGYSANKFGLSAFNVNT
jgi:hypothetical protein